MRKHTAITTGNALRLGARILALALVSAMVLTACNGSDSADRRTERDEPRSSSRDADPEKENGQSRGLGILPTPTATPVQPTATVQPFPTFEAPTVVPSTTGTAIWGYDLALTPVDELYSPIYIDDEFIIGLEVENVGNIPGRPYNLVAYFTAMVDGLVTRVNSLEFGHSRWPGVGAGRGYRISFDAQAPDDLLPGDYRVCVEIEYLIDLGGDTDPSNDRPCVDRYVLRRVKGNMDVYTTLTITKDGHRTWTGVPIVSGFQPDSGIGFAADSNIRDDDTLRELYKRLAGELAFRKALQPYQEGHHVQLQGLMERAQTPTEIARHIAELCKPSGIDCLGAAASSGLLGSGLLGKFPEGAHEAIGFAGQTASGGLLLGDVYFSALINQSLDVEQAYRTLDQLWGLPLGPVWREAVSATITDVALSTSSNTWIAFAAEVVKRKDEFGQFALTAGVAGVTHAVNQQFLHHMALVSQKALAHSLGVKAAGTVAAAGPALFVASVWFASEVYQDVQENQDLIGVATLASFLNAAFSHTSHPPDLREALAYAKYAAYDNYYRSEEGGLQEIASWITFRPGDHDLYREDIGEKRDEALEDLIELVSLESLEVSPETVNLKAGETTDISVSAVTGSGRTANSLALDWSSSAPEIAIVSQNGVVSGVSAGEAVITASTGQVSRTAQVDVSNADSTASTISPTPSGPAIAHSPELDFDGTAVLGVEHPWGIWSDGTTLWVSYYWNEHKIYAFNWASGARVPNQDFDSLDAAGNRNPRGIWSDGETMWVADWHDDDKLYAYSMATKERQPGKDLLLAPSKQLWCRAFGLTERPCGPAIWKTISCTPMTWPPRTGSRSRISRPTSVPPASGPTAKQSGPGNLISARFSPLTSLPGNTMQARTSTLCWPPETSGPWVSGPTARACGWWMWSTSRSTPTTCRPVQA